MVREHRRDTLAEDGRQVPRKWNRPSIRLEFTGL